MASILATGRRSMKSNRISKWNLALLLLLWMFLVGPSFCWSWQGKVVGVMDGDTIEVMHEGKGERIRLYGVDSPEKRQDFGAKAKQFTSDQVFGKDVAVEAVATDRYGRTVGIVSVGGEVLNQKLIEAGFAWVYAQYCDRPECREWTRIESQARASKVGLWSMPNPVAPWEFRHPTGKAGKVEAKPPQTAPAVPSSTGSYHGNTESKVFHEEGCRFYDCRQCTKVFASREEAIKAGYKPCGVCKP